MENDHTNAPCLLGLRPTSRAHKLPMCTKASLWAPDNALSFCRNFDDDFIRLNDMR